jgi:hypothetical protein
MAKQIYRTMQGKIIDMDALMANNETMPAVGNIKVNARGDELGPGGKIVRTKEELMSEYYEDNPNATPRATSKEPKASSNVKIEEKNENPVRVEKPVVKSKTKTEELVVNPLTNEDNKIL